MNTNMNRRRFSATLLSAAAASALVAGRPAFAQATPVEGKDFTRIEPPQPPGVPAGKVEVLEFFSYACPHCNAFEPSLDAWAKKLPADVAFRRVPVPFLMNAELFQRTYFALESLGMVDAMQRKIFAAVHVDRLRLDSANDVAALVAKNGGDSAKFLDAMKSFGVANGVTRAKKMTADYKIDSVPSIAVQGRFVTSPAQAGSPEKALQVADFLIQRSRKG